MSKKLISLTFDLGQVCNDILVKCNLISQTIMDAAMADIKANVEAPDDPEHRSIINRSVTEAFGRVKVACQRYLTVGRDTDDNKLERLVISVIYPTVQKTYKGYPVYNYKAAGTISDFIEVYRIESSGNYTYKKVSDDTSVTVSAGDTLQAVMIEDHSADPTTIVYETVSLTLEIPNFNLSVTDHLKSSIHKYVVDYTMGRFLQDQVADKAKEYKDLADTEDLANIISDVNARERYTMRKPSFM